MSFHKKLGRPTSCHYTLPSPQTRLMCHLTRACLCLLTLLLPTYSHQGPSTSCGKGRHTGICGTDGKDQVRLPGKGEGRFPPHQARLKRDSQTGMVAHVYNSGTVWRLRQEDGCETSLGYRVRPGLTNKQTKQLQFTPVILRLTWVAEESRTWCMWRINAFPLS